MKPVYRGWCSVVLIRSPSTIYYFIDIQHQLKGEIENSTRFKFVPHANTLELFNYDINSYPVFLQYSKAFFFHRTNSVGLGPSGRQCACVMNDLERVSIFRYHWHGLTPCDQRPSMCSSLSLVPLSSPYCFSFSSVFFLISLFGLLVSSLFHFSAYFALGQKKEARIGTRRVSSPGPDPEPREPKTVHDFWHNLDTPSVSYIPRLTFLREWFVPTLVALHYIVDRV